MFQDPGMSGAKEKEKEKDQLGTVSSDRYSSGD